MKNLQKPFYHFSVDDVFESLVEISDRNMDVFENSFFAFLKELHNEFDINVDLYLFYQGEIKGRQRTLKDVSSKVKGTFEKNPWIRFGPHGLDTKTRPYNQSPAEQRDTFDKIYAEIYRFAGRNSTSKWVRLHYFSESFELADYFIERGVEALFTTDKPDASWRMSDDKKRELKETGFAENEGMKFIRSHIRMEDLANKSLGENEIKEIIHKHLMKPGHICFLTHEYEMSRGEVRTITKKFFHNLFNLDATSILLDSSA